MPSLSSFPGGVGGCVAVLLLLCGRQAAAVTFTSPVDGVRNIPVFPLVQQPTNPPILACAAIENDAPLANTPLWSKAGFYSYSENLKELYNQQEMGIITAQLRYEDSKESTLRSSGLSPRICPTRKMLLDQELTFADAVCRCSSSSVAEDACSGILDFMVSTQCISQYDFDVSQCSALKADLLSFDEFAPSCILPMSGTKSMLDMSLDDLLFPAGSQLPDTINPDDSPTQLTEGKSYYLAWMAADRLARYADAFRHCEMTEHVVLVPGWENLMVIYGAQEGEDAWIPMVTLSRRGHESFLVVVRDSRTTFEGRLKAQYEPAMQYMEGFDGWIQEGASSPLIASTGPLDLFFDSFFQQNYNLTEFSYNSTLTHPRILVVGSGGYGSGVAAAFAHHFALKWDSDDRPWHGILNIDAILFGAPRVGNSDFATAYRTKVNGRNVVSKFNSESAIPCQSQVLCDTVGYKTGTTGDLYAYSSLGGTVLVDPQNDPEFEDIAEWKNSKTRLDFVGHQYCAPKCWLVKKFCFDDPKDMCSPLTCPGLFANN